MKKESNVMLIDDLLHKSLVNSLHSNFFFFTPSLVGVDDVCWFR